MIPDDSPTVPALLGCPFCGAGGMCFQTMDGRWIAWCSEQHQNVSFVGEAKADAIAAWNRRAATTGAVEFPQSAAEAEATWRELTDEDEDGEGLKLHEFAALRMCDLKRARRATGAGGADGEAVELAKLFLRQYPDASSDWKESGWPRADIRIMARSLAATAPKRAEVTPAMVDAGSGAAWRWFQTCGRSDLGWFLGYDSRGPMIRAALEAAIAARADGGRT